MATFSREFLRSLAQPSFQQGLFTAARGIGMRPQMQALQQQQRLEKQQKTDAVQMGLEALGNSDIENLRKASQKFASLNMPEQAAAYMKQALSLEASQREQKGIAQEARGKEALTRYGTSQGMNLKSPAGKEGFYRIADAYDLPAEDVVSLYNSLVEQAEDPTQLTDKDIKVSFQSVLDSEGREVRQAVFTKGNQIVRTENVGFTKGKADDITNYGLTATSTEQDYDMAALDATNAGNNVDARNIESMRRKKFPDRISTPEVLEIARSVEPAFDDHLAFIDNATKLESIVSLQGVAGASNIQERIITSNFPNDLKALAELNQFRSSKSLLRRVSDFGSKILTGQFTDATEQDYRDIAEAMRILGRAKIEETITRLYNAEENETADRLTDLYFGGDNDVQIISIN